MEDQKKAPRKKHSPLVSIVVLAYNHLDYTRQCIESLYKYTSHIDFELITINNGSTDGTKEYFQSLPNKKKISFDENMGVDSAINHGFRMAEGKYTINVSNDLVLTANWLDNLLICAESDEKIGMVVPVCNCASNYQQVNLGYEDLNQMQLIAKNYNISNPLKWQDRLRLVTYACLIRTDIQKAFGGFDEDFNPGGFDDDALSFRVRRAGYRLILAGDTFIHHFGSVTFDPEYKKHDIFTKNRKLFQKKFGVDVWSVCAVDFNVLTLADLNKKGGINILGIGISCGATLLQLKNKLRERGVDDVKLYYISQAEHNLPDLKTICERCEYRWDLNCTGLYPDRTFDYIIVESESRNIPDINWFYRGVTRMLKDGGQLIFTAADEEIFLKALLAAHNIDPDDTEQINRYYYSVSKDAEDWNGE